MTVDLREAAINGIFLVARPLRGGGGGLGHWEKRPFFDAQKKYGKHFVATKLEGVGLRP